MEERVTFPVEELGWLAFLGFLPHIRCNHNSKKRGLGVESWISATIFSSQFLDQLGRMLSLHLLTKEKGMGNHLNAALSERSESYQCCVI